jgi:transcription elongation factor S-II
LIHYKKTGAGKIVNKLTKSKEKSVADLANVIIAKWRKVANQEKKATTKEPEKKEEQTKKPKQKEDGVRVKAKNQLFKSLGEAPENSLKSTDELSLEIEDAVHRQVVKNENKKSDLELYIEKIRQISFNISKAKNPSLWNDLFFNKITATKLAQMKAQDMQSKEYLEQKKQIEKMGSDGRRVDWEDPSTKDARGLVPCPKCKGFKTGYSQLQTRGSDEPMTTYMND